MPLPLRIGVAVLSALFGHSVFAAGPAQHPPPAADPLTVRIHTEDAQRFAQLFAATDGNPSAEQIQKEYLDKASFGVQVFTPDRIVSAAHLAERVAEHHADYAAAIQNCLPRLQERNSDLRAIYLAMHGLLPEKALPEIYVVFGAGNSGGTAGPNAQVLGLEVLCKSSAGDPAAFRATLRRFFAHETVHTFQNDPADASKSPLLTQVLIEGGADFIASIVTGETPEPGRAKWAVSRETLLWTEFKKDLTFTQPPLGKEEPFTANAARLRWINNYQKAPSGWPFEVGYWIGMRIWECYYERSVDKHQAIRDVIDWNDPDAILQRSGYHGQGCDAELASPKQAAGPGL